MSSAPRVAAASAHDAKVQPDAAGLLQATKRRPARALAVAALRWRIYLTDLQDGFGDVERDCFWTRFSPLPIR